jgi:capsular exopolysaccharide synthesis family protein
MSEDNRLLPIASPPAGEPRALVREPSGPGAYINAYGTGAYGEAEQNYLREYLRVILKRKWIILSIALIVTTAAALYMFRIPSIYLSEATLVIENRNPSLIQSQQDKVTINLGDDPTYWNTQLKLLQNPELMRQVAREMGLQNNPEFARDQAGPGLTTALRDLFGRKKADAPKPTSTLPVVTDGQLGDPNAEPKLTPEQQQRIEAYAALIAGNLAVEPIEGTNLVTIKFTHTNPEMAMRVANTVASVFISNDKKRVSSGSDQRREDLAKSIADLQATIKRLEDERIAYQQSHNLPLREEKGQDLKAARLQLLSTQVLTAENERKGFQSAYEAARNAKDLYSIPEVQSDKGVQDIQKRIADLEEKRSQLLVKYTEDWPAVREITKQLEQSRQSMDRAARSVLGGMKARFDASVTKENQLKAAYAQENNDANRQGIDETRLSSLEQELTTNKELYNQLIQQQRTFQISTNTNTVDNIRVANKAQLPAAPIGPNRPRNIVIAFLISLLAGVGLAFLLDYIDDSLKSTDDITRYVNLPTLALIPYMRGDRAFLRSRNGAAKTENDTSTALTLLQDARSPVAEAYRHLRTSLLFSSAGRPPKTILITSGQPMEGKTTTAVNTALSLAQTGAQVLIIDCDLRRPRIHHYLELENIYGVTNFLSGERDLTSLIQSYSRLPNLKVIACGPIAPNPAELLGSNEMRNMLERLKDHYTHIIIDSPPILSFTDAAVLSTLVDGVMVVALSGKSSRALVRRVKQRLTDMGARIYGIVLNGMRPDSLDYGYGYYTDRYSRYYRTDEEMPDEKAV